MKLEITSGTKNEPPMWYNTTIKIDGKEMSLVDYLKFEVKTDSIAYWKLGVKKQPLKNLIKKLKMFFYKLKYRLTL